MNASPIFLGPCPFVDRAYRGARTSQGARVFVEDRAAGVTRKLKHLIYHSPTGLEWGYAGSGPSDLARSLLADFVGFDPRPEFYQAFKFAIVARLPEEGWQLEASELRQAIRAIAAAIGVKCLQCFDDGRIGDCGRRFVACPTCHGRSAPPTVGNQGADNGENDDDTGDAEAGER